MFRYQTNQQYNSPDSTDGATVQQQQFDNGNRGAQKPAQTIHIHIQSQPNARYTQPSGVQYQDQYDRQNQFNRKGVNANNRNAYAERMPYTNNGEQMKLRRYQVHRPGIQKEFYDVEERVIVRPAGSALIELETPAKKQDVTDYYQPYGGSSFNPNQQQKGYQPNTDDQTDDQDDGQQPEYDQSGVIYRVPDCGGYDDDDDQTTVTPNPPVNEYGPPSVGTGTNTGGKGQRPQYHPTTFTPPTNPPAGQYPTTVQPLPARPRPRPFYPSYPTYPTYYPSYSPTTTVYGSYPTVPGSQPRPTTPQYPSRRKYLQ